MFSAIFLSSCSMNVFCFIRSLSAPPRVDEVGARCERLCPVLACPRRHVYLFGPRDGHQLWPAAVCTCSALCVCLCANTQVWAPPPFKSSSCVFGVCLVMDSCLVAGDDYRSQAHTQYEPGRRPGERRGGELRPNEVVVGLGWAVTQTGLLDLCWMAGETQLWVSVFVHDSEMARLHLQMYRLLQYINQSQEDRCSESGLNKGLDSLFFGPEPESDPSI